MLFRRLEKWLLSLLPSRRTLGRTTVQATDEGLFFQEGSKSLLVSWQQINRVVALKRDIFVGDILSLLFETADGAVFELSEENPAWSQVSSALSEHLACQTSQAHWLASLIASQDGYVDIFRR